MGICVLRKFYRTCGEQLAATLIAPKSVGENHLEDRMVFYRDLNLCCTCSRYQRLTTLHPKKLNAKKTFSSHQHPSLLQIRPENRACSEMQDPAAGSPRWPTAHMHRRPFPLVRATTSHLAGLTAAHYTQLVIENLTPLFRCDDNC